MEGGREAQEGGDIPILWLIHVDIWQKETQYYKAIILQLKINKFKKRNAGFQALFQTYGFRTSRRGGQPCVF